MDLRRQCDLTWTVWTARDGLLKESTSNSCLIGADEMKMTGAQFVRWLHDLDDRDREVHNITRR